MIDEMSDAKIEPKIEPKIEEAKVAKAKPAKPAPPVTPKVTPTVTPAAPISAKKVVEPSDRTKLEMEIGRARLAAHKERERIRAEQANPEPEVVFVERDQNHVPDFKTPGTPFVKSTE